MDLGAGVEVVVVLGGVEPEQFDRVDAGSTRGLEPLDTGQQNRCVAGDQKPSTERDRRKRVARVRPGHHRDTHRPTLPQRLAYG